MDNKDEKKQQPASREQFLRVLKHLHGRECTISLYENTTIDGTFVGCDKNLESMAISDMSTPIGPVPHALVRKSDVVAMKFPDVCLKELEEDTKK